MLWEQFRSLALPVLGEHFPPELIEDNGDSIVFTSRRDFRTQSLELAATCVSLLARDGIATLTDMSYTPRDLLGHVAHGIHHLNEVPTVLQSHLDYRSHSIPEIPIVGMRSSYRRGLGPLPGLTAAVESSQSIPRLEEEQPSHERRTRRIHHAPV